MDKVTKEELREERMVDNILFYGFFGISIIVFIYGITRPPSEF